MCMYVQVRCIWVCECLGVYMHIHVGVRMRVYIYIYIHVYVQVYRHVCTHVRVYACMNE